MAFPDYICFDKHRIRRRFMKVEQSLAIMKALADASRLAIVNSLFEQPQYVEELAKRHALAPSTVSFHLKKLEQAGLISSKKEQYYVVVALNEPLFETTLKEIVAAAPLGKALQDERIDEYRRKVIDTFFRNGMLVKLPAQHKKRLIVLEQFVLRFEPGQRYAESDVTGLIRPLFDDYCTIRRLLVDEGMINRDGACYWRNDMAGTKPAPVAIPPVAKPKKPVNERAELKRQYKESRPDMGVYRIICKANGRIFIDSSKNLEGSRTSRLFQLKMGKMVASHELQKDLTAFGADNFEFSILEVLPTPEPGANIDRLLTALKLRWQEKLQPFGERGYNSLKGFQRESGQSGVN
jgi:hypothetical protein